MEKFKSFIKENYKYLILFIIFILIPTFNTSSIIDEGWNYGFSYAIYRGEIPYKDFNMVLTPFFPFLMSIFFHIFKPDYIVFIIANSLFLTGICYLLFKLIKENTWIFILLLCFFSFFSFPSYNLFLVILLIIIIYLEINKGNDYLIGILLALMILTKHSVGGVVALVGLLYYLKDKDKFKKRLIGILIPSFIFLIYLFISNSYKEFIDLCVLGLFDFAEGNSRFNSFIILTILLVALIIYLIRKKNAGILGYYLLGFVSIMLPLFDIWHFYLLVIMVIIVVLYLYKPKINLRLDLFTLAVIIGTNLIALNEFYQKNHHLNIPNDINHFEYRLLNDYSIKIYKEMGEFVKKHPDDNIIYLNANAYYFKIIFDQDITYLDLINTGNWGYHGSDKLLKEVKKNKGSIFVVSKYDLRNIAQTDKRAVNYIYDNGEKIGEIEELDIYLLK